MPNSRISAGLALTAGIVLATASAGSWQAHAADMVTKAPAPASSGLADVNSWVFWTSSDFKTNVAAGNVGGIYAFNGNLDSSGWLVRGQFTYVGYDFASTLAPTGTAHGTFMDSAGAIGYQVVGNGLMASGFIGPDYEQYTTNPVTAASTVVGNAWGVGFFGRLATVSGALYPFAIDGNYSTANSTYWVRARPGLRFANLTLGPEVIGIGNKVFDEFRVGAYASYDLSRYFIIQADVGYADPTRGENTAGGRGGRGAYGGLTLVFLH